MKISVIIPAYNAARWLPFAVESVLSQSRPADEILIVDDGSTDETPELCRNFHKEVKYVRRENGGLAAARNTGASQSSGEWMLFLDADDILLQNAIRDLLKKAENSNAGVVYGYVLQRREKATEAQLHGRPYAIGNPPHPAKEHFWWTPIPTAGCALINRSLNEEVGGFDENFRQVEDAEYWLRCGVTAPFAHCDSVVLDKTYIPTSLGQQTEGSIWYRLQLQRKFLLWCAKRGVDSSFLKVTDSQMINHALKRIAREGAWGILPLVIEQARELGVCSPWYWRSLAFLYILKATGHLPLPARVCPVVYSAWQNTDPS
jgi:glycosyltransferase involved in cell wall biosynthesis